MIKIKVLEFLGSKFSLWALLYLTEREEHHPLKHKQHLLEQSRILRKAL